MIIYDLAISFVWEFDVDFVNKMETILQGKGLTTYVVTKQNIKETIDKVTNKELGFKAYFDRASDVDPEFTPLTTILGRKKAYLINPYKKLVKFINKAIMHNILKRNHVPVPFTLILPPLKSKRDTLISIKDWERLGKPFVIKPAFHTGGGEGVVVNAGSLFDVIQERHKLIEDSYLVQTKIYPKYFNGKRAWFRIIWAFDQAIPMWWNDQTDIYDILHEQEIDMFHLHKLLTITKKIASITNLDYFSTEIAVTEGNNFYVIDYVNDQCDMRIKSKHFDGVPDEKVDLFILRLYEKLTKVKKINHPQ